MPITNDVREMSTTSMHVDTYTQLSNLELIQLGTMRPEDFWKLQWQASLDTAALKMTLGYRYRVIGIQCCLSCSALAERAPVTWRFHTRLPRDPHPSGEAAESQAESSKASKAALFS